MMNTVVGIAQRFDDWSEDASAWTPPMCTSPFGANMPIPDSQFWGSTGDSSGGYHRASPQVAQEELGHGLDATDNYDAGYTIDNAIVGPGPGPGPDDFIFDTRQNLATHSISLPNHQQLPHGLLTSHKRQYSHIIDDPTLAGEEDVIFDDSLTCSTATAASKRFSQTPETMRSPMPPLTPSPTATHGIHSGMGSWTVEESVDQPPHLATAASSGSSSNDGGGGGGGGATKSKRNRERNRVAAHKCRQKAKQSMSNLQAQERELSQHNRLLQEHAGYLRDEVLDLKNEILRHSSCDSDIIQNYIARAARDVHSRKGKR
ncbi:hypothetical protein AAE478_000645 [Parahypoxylon ruwenzoriense]